jgi:hypothetical protein
MYSINPNNNEDEENFADAMSHSLIEVDLKNKGPGSDGSNGSKSTDLSGGSSGV